MHVVRTLCLRVYKNICGCLQMFLFYFASSRVIRSVPYGKKPRQRLDIFVPKNHWKLNDGLIPVVIYVTGMQEPPNDPDTLPLSCSKLVSFHAYRKHVGKVAVTAILFCASA